MATVIRLETTMGAVTVELYTEHAPKASLSSSIFEAFD